ncbi:hypothetical protein GCM10009647_027880 [Streptomyces sanglieri]|uniref:hypothetical protein n=1 Tax=Streptomyces sp. Wh19 TaxID=3076629 RepID=UPI002958C5D4|nr:hypothetical protein [Streptomyces sp. Wh19]MDV9196003.1 hypothetical protein [Streptomyces sp. Wh19]
MSLLAHGALGLGRPTGTACTCLAAASSIRAFCASRQKGLPVAVPLGGPGTDGDESGQQHPQTAERDGRDARAVEDSHFSESDLQHAGSSFMNFDFVDP